MLKVPRLYLYLISRAFQFNFSYRSGEGFEGIAGNCKLYINIFTEWSSNLHLLVLLWECCVML